MTKEKQTYKKYEYLNKHQCDKKLKVKTDTIVEENVFVFDFLVLSMSHPLTWRKQDLWTKLQPATRGGKSDTCRPSQHSLHFHIQRPHLFCKCTGAAFPCYLKQVHCEDWNVNLHMPIITTPVF